MDDLSAAGAPRPLIQNRRLVTEGLTAADLSTDRGRARMDAQFSLMQRGLIYPAPFARFVTFWRAEGAEITRDAVCEAVQSVRQMITTRCKKAHTTAIVGVSFELFRAWCREHGMSEPVGMQLAPGDLTPAEIVERSAGAFVDSGGALWFHIKSDKKEHLAQVHDAIRAALGGLVDREEYQDCESRDRDADGEVGAGRVLGCRFAENLNNPADPVTVSHHTLVGYEDVEHAGASFALAQRFALNWDRLHQMTEEQIEDIIGRTTDDIILPTRDTRAHIKSARQQDDAGNSTFVMRLGLPYGTSKFASRPDLMRSGNNLGDEEGIYFAGLAKNLRVFTRIMEAQIGEVAGFMNDRLFNNARSNLGGFFYIPSRPDLGMDREEGWLERKERDWRRLPGVDWTRLSRHFTAKSDNGLMYYNHKNYLYEMATACPDSAPYEPPSTRILTLLMDMFARWQDAWYFEKGQQEMDHLCAYVARDFGPETAREVMNGSIMTRKGWATRMTCRLYATESYGFRGRRVGSNGETIHGADTFRIHPSEILVGALPDLSLGQGRYVMAYLRQDEEKPAFFRGLSEASGVGHVLPDHQKLVDLGLGALIDEAKAGAAAARDEAAGDFYSACVQSLLGVGEHLERYGQLATQMAEQMAAGQTAERSNLQEIADRCAWLVRGKPRTMVEAAQLIFTYHSCLHLNGEPVSLGRLDQYLQPFYAADIAAGRLEPAGAQEIIDALWVKLSEKVLQNRLFIQDHQPYGNLAMGGGSGPYPQGASLGQWIMQVTVGGVVADEAPEATPSYNDVTTLCIRASGRLPLNAPCLSLRVHTDTPRDVLVEAARALMSGGAHPILLNDDKIIPGLKECGDGVGDGVPGQPTAATPVAEKADGRWDSEVSLKSARDYACDGCYEPMFTGQNWFSLGGFTALNPLECALNQGRLYASAGPAYLRGQNLSFRSAPPEEIATFEDLLQLYFKHFEWLWAKAFDGQITTFDALASICPAPLLSVLTDDCLDRGLDIYAGGARYNVYGPCWIGLSTTINSLYNIKTMVFDQKTAVTSLAELVECLMCDWGNKMVEPFFSSLLGPNRIAAKAERFKRLREIALAQPRYGRGNSEVDGLGDRVAREIARITVDVLRRPAESTAQKMLDYANAYGTTEKPFGGFQIQPGTGTFENFVAFGGGSGASADGRRLNETIASDMSAAPSPMDRPPEPQSAPFSEALASYTGDGAAAMWDGSPTDFNVAEDFGVDALADALGQFAAGQGANILTVTAASADTFADAPGHPEKYDLLRVRMGGWTEYFTSMFPESQQQHRRRPVSTPDE